MVKGEISKRALLVRFHPWRFVIVEDSEFKQKLVETMLPIWKKIVESMKEIETELFENIMRLYKALPEPKDLMYYSTPVILFIIGQISNPVSCALACENIALDAYSLGLGNCYVGFGAMVKGEADVIQALELTDGERIYRSILLGHPKDTPKNRFMNQHKSYVDTKIKWIQKSIIHNFCYFFSFLVYLHEKLYHSPIWIWRLRFNPQI